MQGAEMQVAKTQATETSYGCCVHYPKKQKSLNSVKSSGLTYLVAGTGFEPVTFGL